MGVAIFEYEIKYELYLNRERFFFLRIGRRLGDTGNIKAHTTDCLFRNNNRR